MQATDNWTRSAIAAAATEQPSLYVASAFAYERPQPLAEFVALVAPAALPANASQLLVSAAAAGPQASAVKAAAVRAVARMTGGSIAMDAATTAALQKLLDDPATSAAALPIVAKWDKSGVLTASAERQGLALQREFDDPKTSDDRRAELAESLLAVPKARPLALATIGPMLADAAVSDALKARLITTLGESAGSDADAMMIATLARTNSTPIFDQILRRPDATLALLAAMKDGKITPANLGPANVARLRTHPNRQVARQAAALLDTLSPAGKAKSDIIAALTPEIEKPGRRGEGEGSLHRNVLHLPQAGRAREGRSRAAAERHGRARPRRAPDAHHRSEPRGRSELLAVERHDEEGRDAHRGDCERERSSITLRNTNGDLVIAKEDIATRENTRRSLMPEGFEALGAEALRDILTFVVSNGAPGAAAADDEQKFRIIDLREAYTADSRRGLRREDERDETVTLHRFGDVSVAGVPFFVMDPARSVNGANLIALKGGPGHQQHRRRVPPARRDSDDGHRREPALPGRRRRVGLAGRRRRRARRTGDEGDGAVSPTARPRNTCSRTARPSPTRSPGRACRSAPMPATSRAEASCATSP